MRQLMSLTKLRIFNHRPYRSTKSCLRSLLTLLEFIAFWIYYAASMICQYFFIPIQYIISDSIRLIRSRENQSISSNSVSVLYQPNTLFSVILISVILISVNISHHQCCISHANTRVYRELRCHVCCHWHSHERGRTRTESRLSGPRLVWGSCKTNENIFYYRGREGVLVIVNKLLYSLWKCFKS